MRLKPKDFSTYMTSSELAEMFNIHPETVRRLRRSGRIKGYRLLHEYRYDPQEVRKALYETQRLPSDGKQSPGSKE